MPEFNAAFRKWFGASRVVDAHGQPLVVYHGSAAPVSEFLYPVFLAFDYDIAKSYGAHVLSAYVHAETIIAVSSASELIDAIALETEDLVDDRVISKLRKRYAGKTTQEFLWNMARGHDLAAERAFDFAGFDAVKFTDDVNLRGDYELPHAALFVADPLNIKAVDNDGTWDADDPDIRSNPYEPFVRFEHRDGLGLMNRTGFDAMRLTDDEDFELTELLTYGLRQPVEVSRGAVFAFTPEGVQKNARLIKLLRKASITGVKKITLDPEAYRIVWQSDDGQVALVPA